MCDDQNVIDCSSKKNIRSGLRCPLGVSACPTDYHIESELGNGQNGTDSDHNVTMNLVMLPYLNIPFKLSSKCCAYRGAPSRHLQLGNSLVWARTARLRSGRVRTISRKGIVQSILSQVATVNGEVGDCGHHIALSTTWNLKLRFPFVPRIRPCSRFLVQAKRLLEVGGRRLSLSTTLGAGRS